MEPGLHYCKGLEARYANDVQLAIKEFNMARKDSEWGPQAIFQMVELYLNPDHEAVWDEANEGRSNRDNSNAVEAAVKLLYEVPVPSPFSRLLISTTHFASREPLLFR